MNRLSTLTLVAATAGVLGFTASADAQVLLTTADENTGAAAIVPFRNFEPTRAKVSVLRFDLSSVTGDLSGAMLSFNYSSNRNRALNVFALNDGAPGESFDEGSAAYVDGPGILTPANGGAAYNSGTISFDPALVALLTPADGQAGEADGGLQIVDTRPNADGRGVAMSSTTNVNLDAFFAADTNDLVTLYLYHEFSDANHTGDISTKENVGGLLFPTLILPNATLVPEPGSLALLGLGGLALRRRRA